MRLMLVSPSMSEMSAKTRLYYHCAQCARDTRGNVYADLNDKPGTYYCAPCAAQPTTTEN